MRTVVRKLNRCAIYVSAALLGIITVLIVLEIFLRNVFQVFIPGVFELTQLFLSAIVFLAIAYANDNPDHLDVSTFFERIPKIIRWLLSLIRSIIYLAIVAIAGWFILRLAISQIDTLESTMVLQIVLWPLTITGAVGMLLLLLSVIADMIGVLMDVEVTGQ
jgi:TRAP-type C4-dicarboxylate transport system permease small subunit